MTPLVKVIRDIKPAVVSLFVPVESEQVYREDLRRHPNNPWSLHGLAESLARQGKTDQSAVLRAALSKATKRCDVKIDRSCYCRLENQP